ncbi:unnamed protein product [Medioppia subpectinata]|uniref:Uncharacterized protein n=1 Tax=Medioppia subpectinata TaxID=1979941 RepID=A0A7R9PW47_9ACAR|nr:unnamed protein product [Medioppia subpectinata]CAG2103334.1 unnamed protein product [Medioppia subpectinata]
MAIIMLNIYAMCMVNLANHMRPMVKIMLFRAVSGIVEICVSCFICGLVAQKCAKLSDILCAKKTCHMSDTEYREWHTLVTVVRNRRCVGFSIGGFAAFDKRTFISIITFMLNYTTSLMIITVLM